MAVDGDSLAVQGGEGQEDGERDEEADQGEREEDHRHLVDVEVESDVRKVNAGRVVCPAPTEIVRKTVNIKESL